MDEKRWERIEAICGEALDLPAVDRARFVAEACGDDAALRDIVLSLVDQDAGADEDWILDRPPVPLAEGQSIPERIGPFTVLRLLGRGGMGEVYLCERAGDGFRLRAAVKLIRRGLAADDVLRRFGIERRILASLDHPGIARFLDGGATEDGTPFFVMEYVDGVPLLEYCDDGATSVDQRVRLFLDICDAVEHAHQRLIVHRDLKPSNILVTRQGTPKLLDFGVAKLLAPDDEWGPVEATRTGAHLLTPQYASPEQLRGAPVTTASDVYSLGVVLYELLCGHHPYAAGKETPKELEEAAHQEEPRRPSAAALQLETRARPGSPSTETVTPEDVSLRRATTPERLARSLSGDLDNIVLKALRKEPDRRYASAAALADDLRRHLEDRPVTARPDTLTYRAAKFVRRNTMAVALASIALVTLVGAAGVTSIQSRRIAAESARVAAERDKALAVQGFLLEAYGATGGDRSAVDSLTVRGMLHAQADQVRARYQNEPEIEAELLHALAEAYDRLTIWDEAEPLAREALELRIATVGAEHPDVARTLNLLGWILHERGERDESEEHLRASVGIWRSGEPDPPGLSRALNDLGVLLTTTGRYEEASETLTEALELRRSVYGSVHRSVGITSNNLAAVHSRLGDLSSAAAMYGESARVLGQVLGPDHQRVRVAKGNRASVLAAQGMLEEAATTWAEVVEAQRRVAGQHFATGWALYQYGGTLQRMGRLDEAESVLRESLPVLENAVTRENGHYATATLYLGQTLAGKGLSDEGRRLAAEALEIRKRVYGTNHLQVALGAESLAGLTPDADEAVRLHEEAVNILRTVVGPENRRTLSSLVRLGRRLTDAGRPAEALVVFRQIEAMEAAVGEDTTLRNATLLGMAEAELGADNVARADSIRAVVEEELGDGEGDGGARRRLRALEEGIAAARARVN